MCAHRSSLRVVHVCCWRGCCKCVGAAVMFWSNLTFSDVSLRCQFYGAVPAVCLEGFLELSTCEWCGLILIFWWRNFDFFKFIKCLFLLRKNTYTLWGKGLIFKYGSVFKFRLKFLKHISKKLSYHPTPVYLSKH